MKFENKNVFYGILIVVCLVVLGLIFGGTSNDNNFDEGNIDTNEQSNQNNNNDEQENDKQIIDEEDEFDKSEEDEIFKIGDDAFLTVDEGSYRIKFTKVTETSDRNQFSDTKADRVIIIEYEYENIDMEEDLLVFDSQFKIYDKDGNKLETYPAIGTKHGGSISAGRKTVSSDAFALNHDDNYIELEFYDNPYQSSSNGKFVLEW